MVETSWYSESDNQIQEPIIFKTALISTIVRAERNQCLVYSKRKGKAIECDRDTASFQGQLVVASYQVGCKGYYASVAYPAVLLVELFPIQPEIEV